MIVRCEVKNASSNPTSKPQNKHIYPHPPTQHSDDLHIHIKTTVDSVTQPKYKRINEIDLMNELVSHVGAKLSRQPIFDEVIMDLYVILGPVPTKLGLKLSSHMIFTFKTCNGQITLFSIQFRV